MMMPGEYKPGGDSTVPDSSGSFLQLGKNKSVKVSNGSEWFMQDHQNIYKSKMGLKINIRSCC
jgi:hypothetical protein